MSRVTALIAEDEPILAEALRQELLTLWPELELLSIAPNGAAALEQALSQKPDVLFLDIRMPAMTGLEVACALAEDWDDQAEHPLPYIVFVTAYDQYAIQAFDAQALDYVLKPVQRERLTQCVRRVQLALSNRAQVSPLALHQSIKGVERGLTPSAAAPTPPRLTTISANVGSAIHRIPISDVLFFSASDKYVRVVTAERELLIRTPIKALLPQLDPAEFWQIHRSHLVRASAISKVWRDAAAKTWVDIKNHPQPLVVSRLYTDKFKAM
jgi:DNA-binding LytR/AlgR family response regulator